MKNIKILGSGCKRCQKAQDIVAAAAKELGLEITVEKITDYADIAKYGVAATPGIVVEGKVVHAGGLPKQKDVLRWLEA